MHPPLPVPPFLPMWNLSPKDIAGNDIMKLKVSCTAVEIGLFRASISLETQQWASFYIWVASHPSWVRKPPTQQLSIILMYVAEFIQLKGNRSESGHYLVVQYLKKTKTCCASLSFYAISRYFTGDFFWDYSFHVSMYQPRCCLEIIVAWKRSICVFSLYTESMLYFGRHWSLSDSTQIYFQNTHNLKTQMLFVKVMSAKIGCNNRKSMHSCTYRHNGKVSSSSGALRTGSA